MKAQQRRQKMYDLAVQAGFTKIRFGTGSASVNRMYFDLPNGRSSHTDDLAGLKWQIAQSQGTTQKQ